MELFIEQVKKHPCLWDTDNASYRDITRKDAVWKLVASACGIHAAEAKSQWKRVRDSHREAMRRRKTATIQAQSIGPWKYEKLMEFILPENREAYANMCTEKEDLTISNDDDGIIDAPIDVDRELRRQLKERDREELRQQMYDDNRRRDALTDLFSSLCQKTRDLPKHLQLRVQREIFESVTRAEEEALMYDTNPCHSSNSDSYAQMETFEAAKTKYKFKESPPSGGLAMAEEHDDSK